MYLLYTGTQHDPTRPLEPRELPQTRLKATEIRDGWERMHQRIGVMIGDSPRGPWRRMDEPLLTPSENWAHPFHADPTPVQAPDGRWFLYYKTVDARDKTLKFAVAVADEPAGPYRTLSADGPLFDPGAQHHIEDHHVWFTDGKFHMLFKDMTNAIRPIR